MTSASGNLYPGRRRAVVTGAASGINAEVARLLALKGFSVALIDRSEASLDAVHGACPTGDHRALRADVTNYGDLERAARELDGWGPADFLVAGAGVLYTGDFLQITSRAAETTLRVNLMGAIYTVKAFERHLRRGSVVTMISSIAGFRGAEQFSVYGASKAGVIGFAQALRAEWEDRGIRVHTVAPPPANTPMVQSLAEKPRVYSRLKMLTATGVAITIVGTLDGGDLVVYCDRMSAAMHTLNRLAPGLSAWISRKLSR